MSLIFLPCVAGPLNYGPGRDQYFENVSLLLHCEGSNGGTTITDSSISPKTCTVTGSLTTSTARFKYGTSSILGGATGTMTGDFTIEMFAYGGANAVLFYAGSSTDAWYAYNGKLTQRTASVNVDIASVTTNLSAAWHFVAISRTGTTLKTYVDGTQIDSVTNSSTVDLQSIDFGYYKPNNNLFWTNNWDEIRVTKGVGRYPSSCAVPAGPFPTS